jgi:hypothetical protein
MKTEKHPVEEIIGEEFDFAKNPLYAGNHIRTSTGTYINVFEIEKQQELIFLDDIAHALAYQCRFSGHIQTFYSVAEHSLHVAEIVPDEDKLAALLHDASEAYLVDIPAPIKPGLPDYKQIESVVMCAIAEKIGFQYPLSPSIKEADIEALKYEWDNYMLSDNMDARPFNEVKQEFIDKFHEYKKLGL